MQTANSGDPDQMPRSAASDLGLHCLPLVSLVLQFFNVSTVNPGKTTLQCLSYGQQDSESVFLCKGYTLKG